MYTIEYEHDGVWLPYQRAKTLEEAKSKAANAFLMTKHLTIRITEVL